MFRSLNFWLFLVVLVCGFSFWISSGTPLPSILSTERTVLPAENSTERELFEQPVHLRILNGTEIAGLARQFRLLATGRGFVVEGVGNAPGSWPETLLVCRRLGHEQSRLLAGQFDSPPVIFQWDERMTEDALLIIGEDHARVRKVLAR